MPGGGSPERTAAAGWATAAAAAVAAVGAWELARLARRRWGWWPGGGLGPAGLRRVLGLVPHPENGYFREVWRSGAPPMRSQGLTDRRGGTVSTARPGDGDGLRNELTSIFWMAVPGQPLWWGRNRSDHVHYWQGGGAFEYLILHPQDGRLERQILGPRLHAGEVLQLPVKGGCYKAGTLVRGDHCLVGEAVGPGFDFRDFEWGTAEGLCAVHLRFDKEGELGALLHPDQRRDFAKFYAGA